jgi:hypothetical protein
VQCSLDANARGMTIERRRVRPAPAFVINDDGEGLAPERTFTVVPRRFVAERLAVPETAPVGSFPGSSSILS